MSASMMTYRKGKFMYRNRKVYCTWFIFKLYMFPCKGYQSGVAHVNRLHYLSGGIRE